MEERRALWKQAISRKFAVEEEGVVYSRNERVGIGVVKGDWEGRFIVEQQYCVFHG